MTSTTFPIRTAGMVAAITGAMILAGCSSSKKANPTPTPSATASSAPTTRATPLIQHTLPSSVANQPAARKNVVQTKCAAVPGGWSAEGTATNPSGKTVKYTITVYFTTTQATTIDFATTSVDVEAGKTANWIAEKKFTGVQAQMLCPMPGITVS